MTNTIKHTGIIEAIEGNHIKVRILQASSCSSCKISKYCNATDTKTKTVDVYADGRLYHIRDEIAVTVSKGVSMLAVFLCFVLPLFAMLVTLFGAKAANLNEATSAFVSLGILVPYYALIWCFRNRISRKVSFRLEPIQQHSPTVT